MKTWRTIIICGVVAATTACSTSASADLPSLHREMLALHERGMYLQAAQVAQKGLAEAEASRPPNIAATASLLANLAQFYKLLGKHADALPLLARAISMNVPGQHPRLEVLRNNQAGLYRELGLPDEALRIYQSALGDAVSSNDLLAKATIQGNIASLYEETGRFSEALSLYADSLLGLKAAGEPPDSIEVARTTSNLAGLQLKMGRYDEARLGFERVLQINQERRPNHPAVAIGLTNLGGMYLELGQIERALDYFQRALAIEEKIFGVDHIATVPNLSNVAAVYQLQRRFDDAMRLLVRAGASTLQSYGEQSAQRAKTLNNIAGVLAEVGRHKEALTLLTTARVISERELGSIHPLTATIINNIGLQQARTGLVREASMSLLQAASIVAAPANAASEQAAMIRQRSVALANLGYVLSLSSSAGSIDQAIVYLKLSVDAREQMRGGAQTFDRQTRSDFATTLEGPYHELARLLIERGRVGEAERVLLLLKEAELTQHLRRNGSAAAGPKPLAWTREEDVFRQELERLATRWREHGNAQRALDDLIKQGRARRDGPEQMELVERRKQLENQTRNVMEDATLRFVAASQAQYTQNLQALDRARTELSTKLGYLQRRVNGSPRTAGLLLLPGERGLTIIVTTDQGAVPLMRKVSQEELSGLATRLRAAIAAQGDYRVAAAKLYEHLIAPAEAQLDGAKDIQQWAILPFGSLAMVPFAALVRPDGTHLVQRYALSVLTADGTGRLDALETPTRQTWRGVGLGASQADPEFGNIVLPGVQREICGVVRGPGGEACRTGDGVISGPRYLDAEFTRQRLQFLLDASGEDAEVLHIATHFNLEKSMLMTGDGKLSTSELLKGSPRFGNYDLIALSACDSGSGNASLESLGGMLRSRGAKAVLATLWPVADIGAAPLMVEFYRQRGETRRMSKAEALRQAQLEMLQARQKGDTGKADLSHPYFWAPYVLMGNWL